MLQLPLKSEIKSFTLLNLYIWLCTLLKIFPGMMLCLDHTKLTVSLLGGKKNKLQKSMYKYYANCVCVCVCTCIYAYDVCI